MGAIAIFALGACGGNAVTRATETTELPTARTARSILSSIPPTPTAVLLPPKPVAGDTVVVAPEVELTPDSKTEAASTSEPEPAATPAPNPTATPGPEPTATPSPNPTVTPEPGPTATTVPSPTATPEPEPTATPEPNPTPEPAPIIGEPGPDPTEFVDQGKLIFQETAGGVGCQYCHGQDASGLSGPDIRAKTADDIRNALAGGVPDMGFFTLTDQEIEAVAAYLASLPR